MLRRSKPELVSTHGVCAKADQRNLITQWVNDHFRLFASRDLRTLRRRRRERTVDIFVALLFVGTDRGEVHSSCHPAWLAEREAAARRVLRLQ